MINLTADTVLIYWVNESTVSIGRRKDIIDEDVATGKDVMVKVAQTAYRGFVVGIGININHTGSREITNKLEDALNSIDELSLDYVQKFITSGII